MRIHVLTVATAVGMLALGGAAPPAPTVQIPAGTIVHVRLNQYLSTSASHAGDPFTATLSEPVVVDGRTLLPRGSQARGRVEFSQPAGRLKGRARIDLVLSSIDVRGRWVQVSTGVRERLGRSHTSHNAKWIGGGGGGGALLGAIAGGPVGLLIGAGSGAAAGVAGAVVTSRRQLYLPAETLLTFRLSAPVAVHTSGPSPDLQAQQRQ